MSRIGELAKATLEQKYLLILTRVHRKAGFWSTLAYIEGMAPILLPIHYMATYKQ